MSTPPTDPPCTGLCSIDGPATVVVGSVPLVVRITPDGSVYPTDTTPIVSVGVPPVPPTGLPRTGSPVLVLSGLTLLFVAVGLLCRRLARPRHTGMCAACGQEHRGDCNAY